MEARLLHFSRFDRPTDHFKLSNPTKKGLPIDVPLERTFTEAKILSDQYESGLLEAITEVAGEGGIMDGWQVYAIGKCHKNWDGVKNVNVIVVREKVEDDGLPWKSGATGEWIPTPRSSVTDDL
ncbi:MAG: hypothetical protein L6R38_005358 [Xanthoria sp. 2 TBL-2021]|nr:MAG: hypothetical protein L6R38_005358 [Xanthoria sp. 2 TBL-2021]